MKTYILMKNESNPENAEDIKVNDIYGIYQNRCKAFWECKVANLKIIQEQKKNNPKLLKSYILKEINLETNEIMNSFYLKNRNSIYDDNGILHKIPIFYNDLEKEYNNFIIA